MNRLKWTLNGYELKYNPNQDQLSKAQTNKPTVNANGIISVNNPFNDNSRQFTIDVIDDPTSSSIVSLVQSGKYTSIAENIALNQIMMCDGSSVDYYDMQIKTKYKTSTITSGNGFTVPAISATGIVHLSSNSAIIYPFDGASSGSCSLVFTDENQVIVSKYIYTDNDMKSISSITWDGFSTIYGLNPYGGIYTFNTSNGASSLYYQFSDYNYNKTNNIQPYGSIHIYNGYVGVFSNNRLIYLDSNTNVILQEDYNKPLYISSSGVTTNMYSLFNSSIMLTKVSMAIKTVNEIVAILKSGIVNIISDNNSQFNLIVQNYTIDRLRNRADARYSISVEGIIT